MADDREIEVLVLEYIRNNPHVALVAAVQAHINSWIGCDCPLDKLANDAEFCKLYNITSVYDRACDTAINQLVGHSIPRNWDRFKHMSAEEIYNMLTNDRRTK